MKFDGYKELRGNESYKGYKTWGEMTAEEKGALLLARHEGKTIEYFSLGSRFWAALENPTWVYSVHYRVAPETEKAEPSAREYKLTVYLSDGSVEIEEL